MATIIILVLAGILMLMIEFFLPGMVLGAFGVGCLVAAIVMAFRSYGPEVGSLVLALSLLVVVVGAMLWLRFLPRSRVGQVFASQGVVGGPGYAYDALRTRPGRTLTALNPSGQAVVDGRRYDVVSEGFYVARDTPVRVVHVEGNKIVVRPDDSAADPDPAAGPGAEESKVKS